MSGKVPAARQELITGFYAAFNRRDLDALLGALTADVVWPDGSKGKTLSGTDEVRDHWTRQWAQSNPSFVPTGFRPEKDGRVAVLVRQVVKDKAGATLSEGQVIHVYRFAEDLVSEMEIREI